MRIDLNEYLETVIPAAPLRKRMSGYDPGTCCASINSGNFIPDLIYIRVQFDRSEEGMGEMNCAVLCDEGWLCPGPEKRGSLNAGLTYGLPGGMVRLACWRTRWSAAYNPNLTGTAPVPPPGGCIPDAPESLGGCPLITSDIPPPPPDVDCGEVCDEYSSCITSNDVQSGYTCDATLCTSRCNDRNLVGEACSGLQGCEISEIVKLESEVGGCTSQPSGGEQQNRETVFGLNKRREGYAQCDTNGPCGERKHNGGGSSCALVAQGADDSFQILLILPALAFTIMLRRRKRR
jgi:hypothetical protein